MSSSLPVAVGVVPISAVVAEPVAIALLISLVLPIIFLILSPLVLVALYSLMALTLLLHLLHPLKAEPKWKLVVPVVVVITTETVLLEHLVKEMLAVMGFGMVLQALLLQVVVEVPVLLAFHLLVELLVKMVAMEPHPQSLAHP
jgi:hypothetical protein